VEQNFDLVMGLTRIRPETGDRHFSETNKNKGQSFSLSYSGKAY
jgi:hypothetical protein